MITLSKMILTFAILVQFSPLCNARDTLSEEMTAESSGISSPLLIIRFNRPHLQYGRALYQATKQALEAKPDASFLFNVYVPSGKTKEENEKWEKISKRKKEDLVKEMREMGVPATRIDTKYVRGEDLVFIMIHMYVL